MRFLSTRTEKKVHVSFRKDISKGRKDNIKDENSRRILLLTREVKVLRNVVTGQTQQPVKAMTSSPSRVFSRKLKAVRAGNPVCMIRWMKQRTPVVRSFEIDAGNGVDETQHLFSRESLVS